MKLYAFGLWGGIKKLVEIEKIILYGYEKVI